MARIDFEGIYYIKIGEMAMPIGIGSASEAALIQAKAVRDETNVNRAAVATDRVAVEDVLSRIDLGTFDANVLTATNAAQSASASETVAIAKAAAALVSETNAATSETNAQTAETNAETAETNAETAQSLAETAKSGSEASETAAANSATAAATSETNAAASEAAAAASETAAANSETAAAASEVAAQSSEDDAETAQTAAELAQSHAETAETNAETAETNAETAETAAVVAQTAASQSQTAASTSQAAALASENAAAASQSSATASAASATTSATSAGSSATDAQSSEDDAAISETNAASSATAANASATASASSAVNSSNSATAAASSATAAAASELASSNSKTAAATSETNAATSESNAATSETNAAASETATAAWFNALDQNVKTTDTVTFAEIITSGDVDGRDVSVDGTKLDTIETNADVTDTTNVTASGALMDSELSNIAAVKNLNQGVSSTDTPTFSSIITAGNVDGRDVSADGTKLDTIETSATADQTGSEIKALYEAQTSAFTDAQFTKLSGIEALADVTDTINVTAAGALMDSELSSISSVKNLDQGLATTDAATFSSLDVTDAATTRTNLDVDRAGDALAYAIALG
mgnify:CR=1 FL=1